MTMDPNINLVDVRRQPHPEPCPDCGREHLSGEHIIFRVPSEGGGTRTVWEGCADCWVRRTDPTPADVRRPRARAPLLLPPRGMSAHVKVYVAKYSIPTGLWFYTCDACRGLTTRPTHAEALAAAWEHIKEHS